MPLTPRFHSCPIVAFSLFRLQGRKRDEWRDAVELVFGDMRTVQVPELADIVVILDQIDHERRSDNGQRGRLGLGDGDLVLVQAHLFDHKARHPGAG